MREHWVYHLYHPVKSAILLVFEQSSEGLHQFSGLDQIYIPWDGPVWMAESNLDVAHVYQQRSRSALTSADGHGTLTTWQCSILY
jgi:hypothetical protein